MDYDLKTGSQGHIYLPKRIREAFGVKLKAIPNTKALVIYPEGTSPEAVIASLQVIISDLKLHIPARMTVLCCKHCRSWTGRCLKENHVGKLASSPACEAFEERAR